MMARWTRELPAVLSRPPDRVRPGPFSRRHAVRSARPRGVSGGMSSAQGAVRGVGGREARAAVVSRRPRDRSRRRPWAARADPAHPGRLVAGGARRGHEHCRPRREKCTKALVAIWPRLAGRVAFVASGLDDIAILPTDVVVSSHACGALTDRVLERAAEARARVAVLPCCHDLASCEAGELAGWVESPVAIDIRRAVRLQQQGYRMLDANDPGGDHAAEPSFARRPRLLNGSCRKRPNADERVAVLPRAMRQQHFGRPYFPRRRSSAKRRHSAGDALRPLCARWRS